MSFMNKQQDMMVNGDLTIYRFSSVAWDGHLELRFRNFPVSPEWATQLVKLLSTVAPPDAAQS